MKSYEDHLERIGSLYPQELDTNLILNSLPKPYATFIMKYNTNGCDKPISELGLMVKTTKKNFPRQSP